MFRRVCGWVDFGELGITCSPRNAMIAGSNLDEISICFLARKRPEP